MIIVHVRLIILLVMMIVVPAMAVIPPIQQQYVELLHFGIKQTVIIWIVAVFVVVLL